MLEPHQSSDPPSTVAADPMPPTVPQHSPTLLDLFDMDDFDDEPTASPWWRRWWVAVVAGVVIVALVAGIVFAHAHQSTPAVTYQYARVSQGNLAITVSGTGPVQTALYNLNFAVSGRLAEIDVRVGQQVSAGQVLAKLDPTTLQDAVNQAQIQADLAYDQEQNAIYACQNEKSPPPTCIQQAEDQYAASQAQLKTAKDNLSNATLTATHAGVITAINGSVGGTPGSGSASGASGASGSSGFIQIADPSALQVVASVNEADIAGIATGQTVTFTVSAYSSRVFRGTVSAISPVGQTSSNVVTYPVTITVDNTALQGATLLNGMTANVTIVKQQRTNVLLLPVGAITFARAAVSTSTGGFLTRAQLTSAVARGRQLLATLRQQNSQLSAENPTVAWVVERTNGQWVVKPVVLGLSNGSDYEVLSGLSAGESVVVGEQNGSITSSAVPTTGARGGGLGGGIFGGGRGGAGGNGGGGGGNGGGGSGGGRNG